MFIKNGFVDPRWLNLQNKSRKITYLIKGSSSSDSLGDISNNVLDRMVSCWSTFHQKIRMFQGSTWDLTLSQLFFLNFNLVLVWFLIVFFQISIFHDTYTINNFQLYQFRVRFIKDNMTLFFGCQSYFIKDYKGFCITIISYKYAFISFRVKYYEVIFHVIKDKAFATKDM